jgi:hypothetical protein
MPINQLPGKCNKRMAGNELANGGGFSTSGKNGQLGTI